MSERIAEVVQIKMEPHPDADSLSIQRVENFQVVLRTEDWKDGELSVYIRPDEIVDVTRPEFAWLKTKDGQTKHRVRVKKLRGIQSMGLMVLAPEGSILGENLYEKMGLEHYDPEVHQPGVNFGGI